MFSSAAVVAITGTGGASLERQALADRVVGLAPLAGGHVRGAPAPPAGRRARPRAGPSSRSGGPEQPRGRGRRASRAPPRRPRAAPRPPRGRRGARSARRGARARARSRRARPAPPRCARARRAASRRARPRRRRRARAGGGSGSGAGRRSGARGRRAAARRARRARPRSVTPAAAAASSGSNGSPATAAPASTTRASVGELRQLAGQRGGDRARDLDARERDRRPGAGRRGARASCSQVERVAAAVGVHAVGGVADQLAGLRRAQARRARPASTPLAPAPRASRSGTWRGRTASASSTGAAGGRRSSEPSSSSEPESAQCRSSRISTSGFGERELLEQRARPRGAGGSAPGSVAAAAGERGEDVARAPRGSRRPARPGGAARARTGTRRARRRRRPNGRSASSSDALPDSTRQPCGVRARLELGEQPRLADPRLADDLDARRTRAGPRPASPPAPRARRFARPAARAVGRHPLSGH